MPQHLIATHPTQPSQNAKLLVYSREKKSITHTIFKYLFDFLPKDTAVILNDTKVIKARIFGQKESGGKVEILLNSPVGDSSFKAYIRGKVRENTCIHLKENFTILVDKLLDDGMRVVSFFNEKHKLGIQEVYTLLESIGHVPLPPYIKREDTKEDEASYQTLFAKNRGAVAAPTASLHFSHEMLEHLYKKYESAFITLHVGAGTFKPVEHEDIGLHIMHEEYFDLSSKALEILNSPKKVLAIGTTVARTIEYYERVGQKEGWCDLFLNPENPPKRVDSLLTNFHLPCSTLIMLVASFIGIEETLRIYQEAVKEEYRFFSYGDAMLII